MRVIFFWELNDYNINRCINTKSSFLKYILVKQNTNKMSFSKQIRFNIGGSTFKCYEKILSTFPESKLANLDKEEIVYDVEENEYFFDRNPILFTYIIDSFRKKAVHLPKDICGTSFKEELEFWEIPRHHVAPCCWEALYGNEDDIETVNLLMTSLEQKSKTNRTVQDKTDFRRKMWLLLEEPKSSRNALVR